MKTKEYLNAQARKRYADWRKANPALHPKRQVGDVVGKFTILKRVGKAPSTNAVIWLCRCNCGREKEVWSSNLNKGVKSCGCFKKSKEYSDSKKELRKYKTQEEAAFFSLFQYYKHGARKRKLLFDLSPEQFMILTSGNCFYCGTEPGGNWKLKSCSGEHRASFKFNGIDRQQNDIGYIFENSVTCCWPCNKMKTDQSAEMFLDRIRKIAGRHGEKRC